MNMKKITGDKKEKRHVDAITYDYIPDGFLFLWDRNHIQER